MKFIDTPRRDTQYIDVPIAARLLQQHGDLVKVLDLGWCRAFARDRIVDIVGLPLLDCIVPNRKWQAREMVGSSRSNEQLNPVPHAFHPVHIVIIQSDPLRPFDSVAADSYDDKLLGLDGRHGHERATHAQHVGRKIREERFSASLSIAAGGCWHEGDQNCKESELSCRHPHVFFLDDHACDRMSVSVTLQVVSALTSPLAKYLTDKSRIQGRASLVLALASLDNARLHHGVGLDRGDSIVVLHLRGCIGGKYRTGYYGERPSRHPQGHLRKPLGCYRGWALPGSC